MKIIDNECTGSGRMAVSPAEAVRGSVACSSCGRWFKIKANRNNEATIARHSRTVRIAGAKKTATYKDSFGNVRINRHQDATVEPKPIVDVTSYFKP